MRGSTFFAALSLSLCLAVLQSWGVTLSAVDHLICFNNLMATEAQNPRVDTYSAVQSTSAFISSGGITNWAIALGPYLVCLIALGVVKNAAYRAFALVSFVVLALLSSINGLTPPGMQHDCDLKGSHSGLVMGLSYTIALFVLFFGTIVCTLERIAIAADAEGEKT